MSLKLLPFLALFLSSCYSYQHITVDANLPVEPKTKRYYVEGDGVKIAFDFSGYNFPVNARITNQTDSILFVDLHASSYTVNGRVVANATNPKRVSFSSVTDTYDWGDGTGWETSVTRGSAVIPSDRNTIAIPPGAHVDLTNYPFYVRYNPDRRIYNITPDTVATSVGNKTVKRFDFPSDSRILGANYYVAFNRNWDEAQMLSAKFKEEKLYNYGSDYLILEKPDAQRYTVYKRHRPLATIVLLGLLGFAVVGIAEAADGGDQQ